MGCDRLKTVPEQGEQAELDRKPFGRGLGDTFNIGDLPDATRLQPPLTTPYPGAFIAKFNPDGNALLYVTRWRQR